MTSGKQISTNFGILPSDYQKCYWSISLHIAYCTPAADNSLAILYK